MVRPDSGPKEREAFAESIYREKVKPMLTDADDGKFVVIDLNSGDYEVDDYEFDAEIRLLQRRPSAATYPFFEDVPSRVIYIGGASLSLGPSHYTEPRETGASVR